MTELSGFESLVGVVGAGTMGTGVAQCLAQGGYRVVLVESDPAAAEHAHERLVSALRMAKLFGQGTAGSASTDPAAEIERIRLAERIDELHEAEFVIEAVPERLPLKEKVFAELDRCCQPDAVLASCTSAIPIESLAAGTRRGSNMLGLHFMNPVPLKPTVEVVRGGQTSERTMDRALGLLRDLGKEAIVVGDGPGFVLNRVLMLLIVETAASLEAGRADAASTDAVFERCLGYPMGPLRTADLIGLDNVVDTLGVLREQTGDDRYTPPPALAQLVRAGHFGRKTGRGFHAYS